MSILKLSANIIASFCGKNKKNLVNFETVNNLNVILSYLSNYDNINRMKNTSHYIFHYKMIYFKERKLKNTLTKRIKRQVCMKKIAIEKIIKSIKKSNCNKSKILVIVSKSIFIQENEELISHYLKKYNIKIAKFDFKFGRPGFTRYKNQIFPYSMKYCKRFYSYIHNVSGIINKSRYLYV